MTKGRIAVSGCKAVVTGSAFDRASRTASLSTTVTTRLSRHLRRNPPFTRRPSTTTTRRRPAPQFAGPVSTAAAAASSSLPGRTRPGSRRRPSRPGLGSAAPWHVPSGCGNRRVPAKGRRRGLGDGLREIARAVARPAKIASRSIRTVVRASLARYH